MAPKDPLKRAEPEDETLRGESMARLKHYRAIATRYEKHAANYLALVKLAASRIWLRAYESVT